MGMSELVAFDQARRIAGIARPAALREAAQAVAQRVREQPVRSAEVLPIDRVVVETRTILPDARLVSPLVALVRRAFSLVAADGTRVLVDPSDAGPSTPYEERIASRHPVALRALGSRGQDPAWPPADVVVSTTLALRAIDRVQARLSGARWVVFEAELDAARDPTPLDRPRSARAVPPLVGVAASTEVAPGIALVATPGPSRGHGSVVFAHRGHVHVITHAGVVVDAWTPSASAVPGLREAVRLRSVEATVRGDASDPTAALEAMTVERALADPRGDVPALHRMLPSMELVTSAFYPRMRPFPGTTLDS